MMNTLSEALVNEEVVCVIKRTVFSNKVELDYLPIKKLLMVELQKFEELCAKNNVSLGDIAKYLENDIGLKHILELKTPKHALGYYSYCQKLDASYQGIRLVKSEVIENILQRQKVIDFNKKNNSQSYSDSKDVASFKLELKKKYKLWVDAYRIEMVYQVCRVDKSILTFSHRMCGWSNPIYQLTNSFSVEIHTNFGYGSASYFYSKLNYKGVDIVPFSEWTNYQYAEFSEIILYTRKHPKHNKYWKDAMTFCRDACNLSLTDEQLFIETYILDECEEMVSKLEGFVNGNEIIFKNDTKPAFELDKTGRIRIEFRAEKISGALDFVSRILSLSHVIFVKDFVRRIEECNRKLQPSLPSEIKKAAKDVNVINVKLESLKPIYKILQGENKKYDKKRDAFRKRMALKLGVYEFELDDDDFETKFIEKYDAYGEFIKEYSSVKQKYDVLMQYIDNAISFKKAIETYNKKMLTYLKKVS